jgi:subtilase family serine protease
MPGNCQACHTVAGVAILPDKINTTCGSCHGGGTNPIDNPPSYGVFWRSEAFLAANAAGMHWIGSDLVISALSLSTSTTTPGGAISVTDSTKNRGGTPAGGSTTAFFLSSNSTCGDGDDVLLSPARSVPALDYNETSTGTTSVTIPGGTVPGTYYICAKADNGGVITEFDETNNTRISSALSVAGNDVDLVILSFSAPTSAKRGTNISIGDATRNRLAGTAGASTTAFYLSADTTLNGGDTLLGSRAVPSLAGGATSSGTTTVTIPAGTTAGAYYLIWKADNGGVITETDETNNTKYKAITITN